MEYIWRNNTGKLKEIESLRNHMTKFYHNFNANMNYIPPALQSKNYLIQYRDIIMNATKIQSASMHKGLLSKYPNPILREQKNKLYMFRKCH